MNKEDFIRDLTDTLQGEVTDYELNDSISYYRDYFNQEMAAGRSEEEILQELGSPKLIGRSIIDARGIDEMAERESQSYQSYQSYDNRGDDTGYPPREEDPVSSSLSRIGTRIVTAVVVVAVLLLVFAVARVMLPFVLLFAVIWWIMSLFRSN